MNNDTIAAIATPIGIGGIGIIRISGSRSLDIIRPLFKTLHHSARKEDCVQSKTGLISHRVHYGFFVDPLTNQALDEILLVFMEAPRSYTREDVIEIQCHGGPAILKAILEIVLQKGARLADPGEFTKRAFLNGRIDLSQAEAISDLIQSKTSLSLSLAAANLRGAIKNRLHDFTARITQILMNFEAGIEFPEDLEVLLDREPIISELEQHILKPLISMISDQKSSQVIREGFRLTIIGRPNVGKSSLMNCLLNKEKSIVTPVPGTTRDLVEDYLSILNCPVTITDTAGVHQTSDPVECIGIDRALESAKNGDLVLFVQESHQIDHAEDHKIITRLTPKKFLRVINKCDLLSSEQLEHLSTRTDSSPRAVFVSATTGYGLDQLKRMIAEICSHEIQLPSSIMTNVRQHHALQNAADSLQSALKSLKNNLPDEFIVMDLQQTVRLLQEITGESLTMDLIDRIFEHFCIGK